ncbi:hypothetical protein [Sandaracinus amylolyticus]|uniref:hypothetical protein n=1 Tax=Sandaracinus amylolyticus TaxID=927083 RepID=UPI001F1D042B|nr:hypothetical protein [Sandaracinus amylolyticus]UJR82860.1 Hypothetical protein I5071_49250 [Sandaracinus amylolyticus]
MRSLTLSMAFFALMKLCGSSEQPTPPVGAAATGALTVTAQHGGVMVAASDDAWIELVTKQDGQVEAYVVDATGAPMPHAQAQVTAVQVQGSDGRPHDVALAWDEGQRRYAGRVEVTPVAAPAEVQLVVRGQPRRARAPQVILVPPTPPSATVVVGAPQPPRATVVVERPQPPQATVVVQAPQPPSATVVVQPPQPPHATVVLQAPEPPRATVVVQAPEPPRAAVVVERPRASATVVVTPPVAPRATVVVAPPPPPVVIAPPRPGVVVVEGDGHPGRGRGHAYGRRGREAEASVVVSPPRPGAVIVAPPSPGRVSVSAGVEVRGGGGGGGRGRGRGH